MTMQNPDSYNPRRERGQMAPAARSTVSIKFYAVQGSPLILQAPAYSATLLTVAGDLRPLTIKSVRRNGVPLKFRALDGKTVCVSPPIPFEADRIELLCETAEEPQEGPQGVAATYPLPEVHYGLQRRSGPGPEVSR